MSIPSVTPPSPSPSPTPVRPPAPAPALPYLAPSVTFASVTCRETATNWVLTWTWTATGGQYVDLGSTQAGTRVVVTGGTRTWTFNTTESQWGGGKGTAPTTSTPYLARILAPIGQEQNLRSMVRDEPNGVPVHCS